MRTERMSSKKPPRILSSIEIARDPLLLPMPVAGPIDRCWQAFIDTLYNAALGPVASLPTGSLFANRSPLCQPVASTRKAWSFILEYPTVVS